MVGTFVSTIFLPHQTIRPQPFITLLTGKMATLNKALRIVLGCHITGEWELNQFPIRLRVNVSPLSNCAEQAIVCISIMSLLYIVSIMKAIVFYFTFGWKYFRISI